MLLTHVGYGRFGGTRTTGAELTNIFNLMEQNGLLNPPRLLTGITFTPSYPRHIPPILSPILLTFTHETSARLRSRSRSTLLRDRTRAKVTTKEF